MHDSVLVLLLILRVCMRGGALQYPFSVCVTLQPLMMANIQQLIQWTLVVCDTLSVLYYACLNVSDFSLTASQLHVRYPPISVIPALCLGTLVKKFPDFYI